jgi:hypothetical protein
MRIDVLVIAAASLAAGGCVIGQNLGETAGDESGSAGDGSSGGPSSATDDGTVSLSGTSATPGDESSSATPGDGTTLGDATDSDSDDGSSSDGVIPDHCPLGPDSVHLHWTGPGLDAVEGLPAVFEAALQGTCAMEVVATPIGADPVETSAHLLLDCTLDGRMDGMPVSDAAHALDVELFAADIDFATLSIATSQDVQLRLAADFWGMGWGVWFVITRGDGTILLDVVRGPYASPTEPAVGISEHVVDMLGGEDWHGGLLVNAVTTECEPGVDQCGGEQRAIELGWLGTPQVEVEVEQLGMVTTDIEETWYRAHVETARAYPRPMCTDLPEADYAVAIWAEEP